MRARAVLIEQDARHFADICGRLEHMHGANTPLFQWAGGDE